MLSSGVVSVFSVQGRETSQDQSETETETETAVYPQHLLETEEEEEAAAAMLMRDGELHNRIEPKMGGLGEVSVIVPSSIQTITAPLEQILLKFVSIFC